MDPQLKRGLLEICVLAATARKDCYGYGLIREVSRYIEISESTLYPILRRLETAECVSSYSVEHNGRLRKYYRITGTGRSRISEFLSEWDQVMKVYEFIKGAAEDDEG